MQTGNKISKIVKINKNELLLLSLNEDFIKSLAYWRKKIGIDKDGFKNQQKVESLYKEIGKSLLVAEAAESLMKDFKISKNYQLAIINKILYGKFNRVPLNYAINLKGDYVSVEIYKRPTKDEWVLIKKGINITLEAIESNNFNFLKKFNYPNGAKVARPKRNIHRDLKILKKSKLLQTSLIDPVTQEFSGRYTAANIEAAVFPESSIKQSRKNIANIRKIRSRYKRDTKGTT